MAEEVMVARMKLAWEIYQEFVLKPEDKTGLRAKRDPKEVAKEVAEIYGILP